MIWIVFAAMTGLALLGLLRPLLKPAGPAGAARVDYDLAVYKVQLGEIARDVERGLLSPDQADAARTEIQRRMLGAAEIPATGATGGHGRRLAIVIALVLPLLAVGTYLVLGSPDFPDQPYRLRAGEIAQMREREATIQAMVGGLAQRLKDNPSDGKGWAMLGRSYRALGRVEEAKEAYAKAVQLLPGEVRPRVEYALLLIDEAQGLVPEAVFALRDVLAIDPNQPEALFYVAQAEAMIGKTDKAREMLTRLYGLLPEDSPGRDEVKQQLDALK